MRYFESKMEQINNNKIDRRIKKSDKALLNAMKELLKIKKLSKISVTELCEKADVCRNTFYSRYCFPEDVLKPYEDALFHEITERILPSDDIDKLATFCRFLKENSDIAEIISSPNYDNDVFEKIFELADKSNMLKLSTESYGKIDPFKKQIISRFSIAGGAAILRTWIQCKMSETPETVSEYIVLLCNNGSSAIKE